MYAHAHSKTQSYGGNADVRKQIHDVAQHAWICAKYSTSPACVHTLQTFSADIYKPTVLHALENYHQSEHHKISH
jgi:hypothetical protein